MSKVSAGSVGSFLLNPAFVLAYNKNSSIFNDTKGKPLSLVSRSPGTVHTAAQMEYEFARQF